MDQSKIALIIPAWNEAGTIVSVVDSIKCYGQVIVVDDASTDETGDKAKGAGALVIRNEVNMKYDRSLEVGLQAALIQGYDYGLTMDADGQHDSLDVSKFISALDKGADLVVGIRPKSARISEYLFRFVGRRLWGMDDPLCGMKAYRLSWLGVYGKFDTYRSIGTQLALRMTRNGALLQQLPINIHERLDRSRFGGILRANLKILRVLAIGVWRYWVLPVRPVTKIQIL